MSKDEIELNVTDIKVSKEKVIHFFKKYGVIFLVLIPILLSTYVRLIPESLPMTNSWAASTVQNYYKASIMNQVQQQYPNLPSTNLQSIVDQQYQTYYQQNKALIDQQIQQTSLNFKAQFQDPKSGYTFMPDIDPYLWLRYARNYLDHGYIGDKIVNGTQWDDHTLAPVGIAISPTPHPVILAYLYEIFHFFNAHMTLMQSSAYLPIIVCALSVIPVFFIGQMLGGNIAGFFAAIMFAVNGALLSRTTWGEATTSSYNIFFPVLFTWLVLLALYSKSTKKSLIYIILGGLTIGAMASIWPGWWYVFDFVLGMMILYVAYVMIFEDKLSWIKIKENKELKKAIIIMILIILSSGIFVTLMSSNSFLGFIEGPFGFLSLKNAAQGASIWPNVFTTVAELNPSPVGDTINSIGGGLFFIISLIGILALLFEKKEGKRINIMYAFLIILWYIGIFYASTQGVRFTMMLAPPLGWAIGAAFSYIYRKSSSYMEKMNISQKVTKSVLLIVFILIFIPYISSVSAGAQQNVPIMNRAWYDVLTQINNESQPNAIINSWWDFGHQFKYMADRGVTFDGASQSGTLAHWIGETLLTDNETEAIGILRMLDCSSDKAITTLDNYINDTPTSVQILEDIIVMNKENAQSYLTKKGIPESVISTLLEQTHCNPPEDYFITSGDMTGKGAVWGHFGAWNFSRADIWTNDKNLGKDEAIAKIQSRLNDSKDDATKVYYTVQAITNEQDANTWIASWPGYGQTVSCSEDSANTTLSCSGITINLSTMDVQIATSSGVEKPISIGYVDNGKYVVKTFSGGAQQSLILIGTSGSYQVMALDPSLVGSTYTKLFYFDGIGMPHFQKFAEERQVTGDNIIVWKIEWN